MKKSLKDNYIELATKSGGTHALISKGVKKGIVNSIMRGSIPKADELYKVAKILNVSIEQLLTGEKPENSVQVFFKKDELEFIGKLVSIFRCGDKTATDILKQTIKGAQKTLDIKETEVESLVANYSGMPVTCPKCHLHYGKRKNDCHCKVKN